MDVEFVDDNLDKLETDPYFTYGLSPALVKAFRKVIQVIRAAKDERDFYRMTSLHFEKLEGSRDGQRSMRLNRQFRLIVEIDARASTKKLRIIEITDYH